MKSKKPLTSNQLRFVESYIQNFNQTQAALDAGSSEASAHNFGYRMMKNDEVLAEIDTRLREVWECGAKRGILTREQCAQRLSSIINFDVAELFYENGEPKKPSDLSIYARQNLDGFNFQTPDEPEQQKIEFGEEGVVEQCGKKKPQRTRALPRPVNKIAAIAQLSRIMGWDKTGSVGIFDELEDLSGGKGTIVQIISFKKEQAS